MSDPNNATSTLGPRFDDVDASEDPRARVNDLDVTTALLAQYKWDGFAALGGVGVWGTTPEPDSGQAVSHGV